MPSPVGDGGLTGHTDPVPVRHSGQTALQPDTRRSPCGSPFGSRPRFRFPPEAERFHVARLASYTPGAPGFGEGEDLRHLPRGFHGAQDIRPWGPSQGAGGSLAAKPVPGPGGRLWPWGGQVALGHKKEVSTVSAWPLGTRPWNSVPYLVGHRGRPSWGPASHRPHGFCRVRELGASAGRLRCSALAPQVVAAGCLGHRHSGGLGGALLASAGRPQTPGAPSASRRPGLSIKGEAVWSPRGMRGRQRHLRGARLGG